MIVLASFGWNQIYFNSSSGNGLTSEISKWQDRLPRGHGSLSVVGLRSAGYVLRLNSDAEDTLYSAPEISAQLLQLYSNRKTANISSLSEEIIVSPGMIKWLTVRADSPFLAQNRERLAPFDSYRITRNGSTLMWVFDLRKRPSGNPEVAVIETREFDRLFKAEFNHWSDRYSDPLFSRRLVTIKARKGTWQSQCDKAWLAKVRWSDKTKRPRQYRRRLLFCWSQNPLRHHGSLLMGSWFWASSFDWAGSAVTIRIFPSLRSHRAPKVFQTERISRRTSSQGLISSRYPRS